VRTLSPNQTAVSRGTKLNFSDLTEEQMREMLYDPHCDLLLEFDQGWMEKRHETHWQTHMGKFLLTILGIRHMQGFASTITIKMKKPRKKIL